eukprot:tig00021045_g17661.t1
MCREGQLVTTRDGDVVCDACGAAEAVVGALGGSEKPGADESPPASPREPSRSEVRMGRLLEGAASALGLAEAAVHEARLLLADRGLLRGRKSEIIVAGALYYAAASAGAPRTVDDALGWHPDLRTRRAALVRMVRAIHRRRGVGRIPRAPDYVDALAQRVGLDGADLRAAREYAERHRDSGRSPIVVAAAALVEAGGASTREAARAAGITTVGIQVCIKALAAA